MYGNCAVARKYSGELKEEHHLKFGESVQTKWMKKRKLGDSDPSVEVLKSAKRGCPC